MARRTRDDIPALVLAVITKVYEVAEGRIKPWYVDRSAIVVADAAAGVNAAIYYAEVSGWLVGAGEPPAERRHYRRRCAPVGRVRVDLTDR
jgi:hypothetical protein